MLLTDVFSSARNGAGGGYITNVVTRFRQTTGGAPVTSAMTIRDCICFACLLSYELKLYKIKLVRQAKAARLEF